MSTEVLFKGAALRVRQPIGEFWCAVIPARVLMIAASPDPLRMIVDEETPVTRPEWYAGLRMVGSQRGLSAKKLEEIGQYVDAMDATFPNSVILSANSQVPDANGESGSRDPGVPGVPWRIEEEDGCAQLVIPKNPKRAAIVDGQHRLFGFFRSQIKTRTEFQLLCAVFFELPLPLQATVFGTINTKQTPVRRAMALNLFGYNVGDEDAVHWSPVKIAVFLARRLNYAPDSPLYGRIKIEALDAPPAQFLPGATRALSLAAVVDGIVSLISQNPSRDGNVLKSERFLRRPAREDLELDGAPLRGWYCGSADRSLYEFIREYCVVCNDVFWKTAVRGSMMVRAVGVRALFGFLCEAADLLDVPKGAPAERSKFLVSFREACSQALRRVANVDFADSFFEASDRGRVRILNVLKIANGLTALREVSEADLVDYQRVMRVVRARTR